MHASTKKFETQAIHHKITIQRNSNGVPTITASNREDLGYGIGYAQASDRLVQLLLLRTIAQGKASEKFEGTGELIEIDKFMRWIHFEKDLDQEIDKLEPQIKKELEAYCQGINTVISKKRRPFEFLMVGYKPEPWTIADSLITAKVMGYIGLAQAQGDMEKFIIQMIQKDVDENKIKALFPYITEKIDYDLIKSVHLINKVVPSALWNNILPNLRASNNWVVAGKKSKTGHPVLASDPHMEVNRLPALWYEMNWKMEDHFTMGITMPGLPVMVMGRTNYIAWGGTYGFMDMIDFFIEDCRDEKYRYDNQWLPFEKREEIIHPKGKAPIRLTFYENHHGVLEGDPTTPGKYLCMAFSGRSDAGADILNNLMLVHQVQTVNAAQKLFREVSMPTFDWVFADRQGNIGFQMNGKMPKRRNGISGLLPIPGWDSKNDWQGFEDPANLPQSYNPESGFFATANNDLNKFGLLNPINLPMAPYRVQRIMEMLNAKDKIDPQYIKKMHFDLFSKQAERLMPLIAPLLGNSSLENLLKSWDLTYQADSKAATLFETIYRNIIKIVFGKYGIGEAVMEHLFNETGIFTDFYGNFDDVLMNENSPWFSENSRDMLIKEAVELSLSQPIKPYGETRKYDMLNIFLGGKLPGFLGFDVKNLTLPGCRATIPQGQIYKNAGRSTTFSPSYRMIVEIENDEIQTNIAGGPSGSRFSKWYKSDLKNWQTGAYKKLSNNEE